MRVINENHEAIIDYDLSAGYLTNAIVIKENALPIDNVTKFAWVNDDYEEVQMYILNREEIPVPTQLDRIEAQVTYTAMITDTLLEV